MRSARVSRNVGDLHAATMAASRRLPVAGKIRPGIKVLTAAARKVDGLAAIYQDGLTAGLSFDEITTRMKTVKGCPNYPLTPRNAAYFSVRQNDFTTPGAAQRIMDRYGSVQPGDPEKRLYGFPVIFPSDDIDLVFREQFEAWKASELLRWSEPDPRTGELMCMRRVQAAPDPQAKRRWGGRPTDAERPCDPNDCDLFAAGECKHVGTLNFWIPGVPGVGTIELTFTSIYASLGVAETLGMVRHGLGRISGLLPSGEPIFWISKRRERVSRMNWETGKPEKAEHWIIQLEAAGLDMGQILAGQTALPAPASAPVAVPALEAPAAAPESVPIADDTAHIAELRKHLSALVNTLGWEPDDLKEWVTHNFGDPAAARDPLALEKMIAELTALAAQPVPEKVPEIVPDAAEVPF